MTKQIDALEIYVPVPTDPSDYGCDCTDEDAELYSRDQAERIEEWLRKEYPGAKINVALVPTTGIGFDGKIHVYGSDGPEIDIENRIGNYIGDNWITWAAEATAEATASSYLECGLTETDLAEITSKRFDTRDEATLWANDLNNNDLEDDWNAAVVRIGRKFTITIKNA